MNIVFRTDASINIGTGHVMRCLTLADELRLKCTDINFICREEPGNMISYIGNRGYKVHQLPGEIDIETDRKLTKEILSKYETNPDGLIIDHYEIDISWEHPLRKFAKRLMVIDDLANREHNCDLLLDQNYSKNEDRYNGLIPENCIQLLGPEYAILRPQFQKARENLRKRDGGVNRILVFMGGVDSKDITSKALRALHMLDRSDIAIDVVIGSQNPYHDEIKILTSKMPNTTCCQNVENMAELMSSADLCIGSGGTTTWERCSVGLPTITIILAENQKDISESLDKEGALINLGWYHNVTEYNIKEAVEGLIEDPQKMASMCDKSRRLVDGEGVNRVCDAMISMVSDRDQYKLILNKELAKIINSISKNYNPEKVILFGSLSGNTIKETSDIDLVVIKQTDKDPWTRMEEVDAYIDHTFPVDVLVYTPDEIRNRLEINDCFVKDILAEGKVLYERTI